MTLAASPGRSEPTVPLNLFYQEPDLDRWLPLDRYPRRVVRRILRGAPRILGQQRVFVNLCAGLDGLRVPYRVNDFAYTRRNPGELACIVGKPHVLDLESWANPILFGASVFSHPAEDPGLLARRPVVRILVPGEWMRAMFALTYGGRVVHAWPVGIDTDRWAPAPGRARPIDLLVYEKVRWERARYGPELIAPILEECARRGLRVATLRYGAYREEEYEDLLGRSRFMLFLCEHETQGIAYQQALSAGVPVLAWDRGGEWRDPAYHPHRVRFGPVTSVPYWDARCGERFLDAAAFPGALDRLLDRARAGELHPRSYVLEHLTLERSALAYLDHVAAAERDAGVAAVGRS
ncbi:MAG TPA: hypothetical protein VNA89_15645 [Gemmatimonadaceae bacterium]|nr:hypothetical protein [Gemmatimonadaceae bacterium]